MEHMDDNIYMKRALELANLGRGQVSPNPMVGCVIVHKSHIIGEGWHQNYGQAHAEVNAINSVENTDLLKESTVYLNLEPCAHHGKTPPCVDLLVKNAVRRVVIGHKDPNPLVGGQGVQKLKECGVEVIEGLLEEPARKLNIRFLTTFEKKRPYIILKWAQTSDGFIARSNFDSKWISNEQSRRLVHKWRAEEDAILVGTNTAQYDNPRLNVREWEGKQPVRIVIDRNLRLPKAHHLFDHSQPTLCYNLTKDRSEENLEFVTIAAPDFLPELLRDLHQKDIQSVMVEGGSQILNQFIEQGLWDEARVFSSPTKFKKGIKAPVLASEIIDTLEIEDDQLIYCRPNKFK